MAVNVEMCKDPSPLTPSSIIPIRLCARLKSQGHNSMPFTSIHRLNHQYSIMH